MCMEKHSWRSDVRSVTVRKIAHDSKKMFELVSLSANGSSGLDTTCPITGLNIVNLNILTYDQCSHSAIGAETRL